MTLERLDVWLSDERVGDLVQERRGFRYRPGSRPLTVSPAGAGEPWDLGFSRVWFDGCCLRVSRAPWRNVDIMSNVVTRSGCSRPSAGSVRARCRYSRQVTHRRTAITDR